MGCGWNRSDQTQTGSQGGGRYHPTDPTPDRIRRPYRASEQGRVRLPAFPSPSTERMKLWMGLLLELMLQPLIAYKLHPLIRQVLELWYG